MATENVQIKFTVDKSQLDGAVTSSKVLEAELKKAGVAAEFMDVALEEVDKTLKDAGVDATKFAKALDSSATSTKSLRTQLAEAKNEAVRMSQQFGAFSKEAQTAAKRAALIKDEINDLNDTLDALNPEAKLNAFVKLGQGIQGGFQAATGALQLFGVENERITKLAQQFQGVLNLTQGINSVLQLKDVYGQLRLVLGVTTTAQNGLNAAMAANPIGAVVLALTIAVGALVAYKAATDDSTEATKRATEAEKEQYNATLRRTQAYVDASKKNRQTEEDLRLQIQRSEGVIDEYSFKLQKLALEEARAIEEIQSKPWSEKSALDESAVKQIKRIYELRRKLLEIESRKEAVVITRAIVDPLKSAEIKQDLQGAAAELTKIIQEELDKIKPIPTEKLNTGINEYLKNLNEQIKDFNTQILFSTLDVFDNLLDSQAQGRIAQLEEEKKAGLITEEKYAKEVSKIKRKQALQDRAFAIFEIAINTAQAITKILATTPPVGVPPLVAAYTALAAAQTAAILSAPLPKFKTGTLNVGGGNLDSDGGMAAIIHRGEAVIPADRNRDYHPTISALFKRQIKPSDINSFVEMKLKGKMGTSIDARISSKDLRNLKPMDTVNIRNTSTLARQIGREIASSINLRRQ